MTTTHFGFQSVDESEKAKHVRGVFDSVAPKYDLMNDLMSMGLHRAWKAFTVMVANLREGYQVLDIAGGTGDLALAFFERDAFNGQAAFDRVPPLRCQYDVVDIGACDLYRHARRKTQT